MGNAFHCNADCVARHQKQGQHPAPLHPEDDFKPMTSNKQCPVLLRHSAPAAPTAPALPGCCPSLKQSNRNLINLLTLSVLYGSCAPLQLRERVAPAALFFQPSSSVY